MLEGFPSEWEGQLHEFTSHHDALAEAAGRACYQSWDNPANKTNQEYLANIIDHGHFSVLEHASCTFYIEGVSRALTHELIRHRHLSYSQLSQRFVALEKSTFVVPPALEGREDLLEEFAKASIKCYQDLYDLLHAAGLSRKQAREAARCVLPNMTETKIVVTGNHRAWREVVQKRNAPGADAEIQRLAQELLRQLKQWAPNTYQDMAL